MNIDEWSNSNLFTTLNMLSNGSPKGQTDPKTKTLQAENMFFSLLSWDFQQDRPHSRT